MLHDKTNSIDWPSPHALTRTAIRRWLNLVLQCTIGYCVGCGGNTGSQRYDYTGQVTYQGKPVVAGYITFAPDKSQGNIGPGSHADIENGRYATMPGSGVMGGPHIVTVHGFDGVPVPGVMGNPSGQYLFENRQLKVDLPKKSVAYDIEVPTLSPPGPSATHRP